MHVGQTVDSLRLRDVVRALELLRSIEGVDQSRITIAGDGTPGVLGLYAAILDPKVHQVLLLRPPTTHADGPVFLNVLRYADLPEAAALLAPRRLNFYGRIPVEFEPGRHVWELYQQPDSMHLTMDLEAVLQGVYDHRFASGL
ncbi:MAG: hypothetical protein GY953_18945 [bacterium]|nr:hypothetical protein [bacterium]